MFSRGESLGILGVFPEILMLIELATSVLIDWLFWLSVNTRPRWFAKPSKAPPTIVCPQAFSRNIHAPKFFSMGPLPEN